MFLQKYWNKWLALLTTCIFVRFWKDISINKHFKTSRLGLLHKFIVASVKSKFISKNYGKKIWANIKLRKVTTFSFTCVGSFYWRSVQPADRKLHSNWSGHETHPGLKFEPRGSRILEKSRSLSSQWGSGIIRTATLCKEENLSHFCSKLQFYFINIYSYNEYMYIFDFFVVP